MDELGPGEQGARSDGVARRAGRWNLGGMRHGDLRDEAIASTVNGLDEVGLDGRVAKRPADFGHADLEHPVGHVRIGPDSIEELLLRDELTGALDQRS